MEMEDLSHEEHDPLLDDDSTEHPQDARHTVSNAHRQSDITGIWSSKYVAACALFSALGGLLFGYDQGVVSIILVEDQFIQRFWQVADDAPGAGFYKGLLTAMIELGALIGAFNQGWIADRISRKYSIMLASAIFVLGSVMQTTATSYETLIAARFVGGIGIGMLSMVAPLYISEISPAEIRGSLLVLEELSIVTGIVVAFWITYATRLIETEVAWRLPFAIQIVPGLLLGIGIYFLPFSPRWLAAQNRDDEALESLSRLRQASRTDARLVAEWTAIRAEVTTHQEAFKKPSQQGVLGQELAQWKVLFSKQAWRRTQVGIGIMFFQQFVGINALIYYSPTMLRLLGLDYNMQLVMSGIINMAQLAGVVTSIWSMDHLGRRQLLMIGSTVMFICHIVIAILVGSFAETWGTHSGAGWMCVALLLLWMFVFGASWGPVPWAVPSEIFPTHLRARGVALSACSNWINNAIIGIITPPLVQNTGYGTYAFFATFCLLSLVWTYAFVPETARKSLEEISASFDG